MRTAALLGASALLLASAGASASPVKELTVRVLDPHGLPVPTATVRFADEGERHPVNAANGRWTGDRLYLADGRERELTKGSKHTITIAAPGYEPETLSYRMHRVNNLVVVRLEPMGVAAVCDARPLSRKCRRATDEHGQPRLVARVQEPIELTPEVLQALADMRDPDPQLTAAFSSHLLGLGPAFAEQADFWAIHAEKEARVLSGDDYVKVMDGVFEVRTKAASQQWQAYQHAWLTSDLDWQTRQDAEEARKRAAVLASEWAEWAEASGQDDRVARSLCLTAEDAPGRCH